MIQALLVDDHPSVMEGTKLILEQEGDITVTLASTGAEALACLKVRTFDILLFDLNMPGLSGIELVKAVLDLDPKAVILIYTGFDIEPHFNRLVEAGVSGFIPKTASRDKLVTSIRCALNGDTVIPIHLFRRLRRDIIAAQGTVKGAGSLSIDDKELFILEQLAQGKSNKEIAEILITSQRTFEYSLTQLFQKLGVKSRKEAVSTSKQLGLLISEDFI